MPLGDRHRPPGEERVGKHPGFVQVLVPVQSERLYGQRVFWPMFEVMERSGLVVAQCDTLGLLARKTADEISLRMGWIGRA